MRELWEQRVQQITLLVVVRKGWRRQCWKGKGGGAAWGGVAGMSRKKMAVVISRGKREHCERNCVALCGEPSDRSQGCRSSIGPIRKRLCVLGEHMWHLRV